MKEILKKNKGKVKYALMGLAVITLFVMVVAFSGGSEQAAQTQTELKNNDNMSMGDRDLDKMSEDKRDAHERVSRMEEQKEKKKQRDQSIWDNNDFNTGLEKSSDSIDGPSLISEKNNSTYLKAQRQIRAIEERKKNQRNYAASKEKEKKERERKEEEAVALEESNLEMEEFFSTRPVKQDSKNNPTDSSVKMYATVKGSQKIRNGQRITLMLSKASKVNGITYPRNTLIYGITQFTETRVKVSIKKINHNPVDLTVFDAQDGLEGIYIEGQNLLGETVQEASEDGINDIDVGGVPVGDAVKSVFRKKQREIKVQLLNDYKLIIKSK